ncbi:MAG: hypothetical protein A2413_01340 [Treponema sp. RIFOXYC1_FULL_61_9]|nr:MAG: hypothetical protein A2413_01340 [Treponema sp. RIFOXYC1_FULL_61_9]
MKNRLSFAGMFLAISICAVQAVPRGGIALLAGTDGICAQLRRYSPGGTFGYGFTAALGFENADFSLDDPALSLFIDKRILSLGRWEGRGAAEFGGAVVFTGYGSILVPYAGVSTVWYLRLSDRVRLAGEAGLRSGRAEREVQASLELADVRFKEEVTLNPILVRLGIDIDL